MKTCIWTCVAIVALFVSVESLTCYTCDDTILGYCAISGSVICPSTQNSCYSGVVTLSGLLGEVQSKGCIASTNCKNTTQSIFNFKLNITMHCCSTDLCNGAESGFAPLNVWAAMGTLLLAFGVNFSV
ncbi:lymphocyte antigen 6B-like [Periophthalmus magnuspinnatus]|uniref:lymphocyte antigen 6B-like n=1 Tax=Periophthalmus magnuspinnatus TaxID=409849 RepID=UPI00145B7490|nr:lymphocyte antigen 6B-like [Periophthalmus magnuspinnatus]